MSWKDVACALEPDGFYRQVQIAQADLNDWQAVLDGLAALPAKPLYTVDGAAHSLPTAAGIFQASGASPLLQFKLGPMLLFCDFLAADCVEFYFKVPAALNDGDFARLEEFLRFLGQITGKPVELSHDCGDDWAIVRFDPRVNELAFTPYPTSRQSTGSPI